LSKGFGDLEKDGVNVLMAASFDRRESLYASQRFSKSGIINFGLNGKNYLFFNGSPRSIPGNVNMPDGTGQPVQGPERCLPAVARGCRRRLLLRLRIDGHGFPDP
jgi:hypothetical protein